MLWYYMLIYIYVMFSFIVSVKDWKQVFSRSLFSIVWHRIGPPQDIFNNIWLYRFYQIVTCDVSRVSRISRILIIAHSTVLYSIYFPVSILLNESVGMSAHTVPKIFSLLVCLILCPVCLAALSLVFIFVLSLSLPCILLLFLVFTHLGGNVGSLQSCKRTKCGNCCSQVRCPVLWYSMLIYVIYVLIEFIMSVKDFKRISSRCLFSAVWHKIGLPQDIFDDIWSFRFYLIVTYSVSCVSRTLIVAHSTVLYSIYFPVSLLLNRPVGLFYFI